MAEHTVLLIAFHFPPIRGSSGIQRTLRFAQYLPRYGWKPIVLTVTPGAYEAVAPVDPRDASSQVEVHRAFALDAARHMSLFGRYPRSLAMPDRWISWKLTAVPLAMRLIRTRRVDAVWSTFPIATAHAIGLAVARRSRLPWVAEFRDPMWQGDYPPDPHVNRAWKRLESEIFARADRVVVTTRGAAREYTERFRHYDPSRIALIENGYDEDAFGKAEASLPAAPEGRADPDRKITLLHSGLVYPSERDPTCLFEALAALKASGVPAVRRLQVVLRACGDEARYRHMIEQMQIHDLVRIEPAIDYLAALQEMLTVDGLLILQAANCNAQIPAKLYEYFRAGRQIVALTDPAGDTAAALRYAGTGLIAPLDSTPEIERALLQFLQRAESGESRPLPRTTVECYSREHQAGRFADLLDRALGESAAQHGRCPQ